MIGHSLIALISSGEHIMITHKEVKAFLLVSLMIFSTQIAILERFDYSSNELKDLEYLINTEDTIIEKWYFNKSIAKNIPINKVSKLLKVFKI